MRNRAMSSILIVATPAMIVAILLALSAAAGQKLVPFKGSLQGAEIDTPEGGPPPTTLTVNGNTTGLGTHVGQFAFSYQLTVTLATGHATGTGHLVAANGDSIDTTIEGQGTETDTPNVDSIVEMNAITGGTGRFSGAQGNFTVERLVNLATGVTSGSFQGTITSPGATH
jgi:hypothetical protein